MSDLPLYNDVEKDCELYAVPVVSCLDHGKSRWKRWSTFLVLMACAVTLTITAYVFTSGLDMSLGFHRAYSWCTSKPHDIPDISEISTNASQSIAPRASVWQPSVGSKWDYHLQTSDISNINGLNVLFVDVFDVKTSDIATLHSKGIKAVCYFSAGTAENWRSDYKYFTSSDLGNAVSGWAGEKYVDIKSTNVRNMMVNRIKLAASKNCDGVDPDNVDSYTETTGKSFTASDAASYVNFLAAAAHSRGLAIGLKNAPGLISSTLSNMQWSVCEQCHQYKECSLFSSFISSKKPVFNVEYPKGSTNNQNSISATSLAKYCNDKTSTGFSIIIKNLDLDDWVQKC